MSTLIPPSKEDLQNSSEEFKKLRGIMDKEEFDALDDDAVGITIHQLEKWADEGKLGFKFGVIKQPSKEEVLYDVDILRTVISKGKK